MTYITSLTARSRRESILSSGVRRLGRESTIEVPWKAHGFQPREKSRGRRRLQLLWTTSPIALFQSEPAARLLLDTVFSYRERAIFRLYEFVIMPDHVHLLLAPTPNLALERAMQFIKGGYSHRFMKETSSRMEIWQRSFTNHRIRDIADFEKHRRYIHLNPVRAGLVEFPKDYPYSSAHPGFSVDEAPQRLKPAA